MNSQGGFAITILPSIVVLLLLNHDKTVTEGHAKYGTVKICVIDEIFWLRHQLGGELVPANYRPR